MIDFSNARIHGLAVHRVGNKNKNLSNFVSSSLMTVEASLGQSLLNFFLKPFGKSEQVYQFRVPDGEMEVNPIYTLAQSLFEDRSQLLPISVNVLEHLYQQSDHPNIKTGELFVVNLADIQVDDELLNGIGIFKAEKIHRFFRMREGGASLAIDELEGIMADKLDKGCLILNVQPNDGFRVLSVDNNRYDAGYWLFRFLNVDYVRNESFHTRSYLELCDAFSNEVVGVKGDARDKVQFMSDSLDYFSTNEKFDFDDFARSMIPDDKLKDEFKSYQKDYALDEVNQFDISPQALTSAMRKVKSTIKLDTNIKIQLDLNHPETCRDYIEKGYDEEKEMFYYKVFFNEEDD